jgi:hypothetical protein
MVAENAARAERDGAVGLRCQECGAELALGESGSPSTKFPGSPSTKFRTTVCPYCACPTVVERPAAPDRPNPAFVLPFTVTKDHAVTAVRTWQSHLRLFRRSLDRATIEEIRGIYVPAYLYSAEVSSRYRAEIGENYTVVETYTTTVNGKTVTRTRTVTEWRDLAGEHAAYATDLLVTASRGLPNAELERIEPFDLRSLRRYGPALVSGWLVEEPSLSLAECTELAREEAKQQEAARLREFMPGDTFRDLRFSMAVESESIEPSLVPVWVLAVKQKPNQPAIRVLANGQSGQVWGPERLSPLKILLWVLGAVLAVVLLVLLAGGTL